ncbi:hypothetical protein [Roseovarius sp. M141]|uniref:hypothetical protein n=1 Tax=Roseovarius sp. M141 TaxID=2583806 RepID=UPI0034E94527
MSGAKGSGSQLSPGTIAALVVLATGALCMVLVPHLPWLDRFPGDWALPMARWVDTGLTWFLNLIKPGARMFSAGLAYPMGWAQALLLHTPWPLLVALVTALGWVVGGCVWRCSALPGLALSLRPATGWRA